MPDFTYSADFGSSKTTKPTTSAVKFGDGYEARYTYGVNNTPRTWTLQFQNREISEIDAIEAFFVAKAGVTPFSWAGLRGSDSPNVICTEWTRTADKGGTDSLSATFQEVFDP